MDSMKDLWPISLAAEGKELMPLQSINDLMARATDGGYAVGYFESWNLESLQGVVDAAEQTKSPVILGFNGEFLSGPQRRAKERSEWYAALGRAACLSTTVPCGLIFNECSNDQWIRQAVTAGFNLVMPADASRPYEQYVRWVAELVKHAHEHSAAVEGEVGILPHGDAGGVPSGGIMSDPLLAERFVESTGVDLLAVSVGNVHVMTHGQRGLDLQRLEAIHRRIRLPLVLHGGSGIPSQDLKEAIRLGVRKVNFGTYVKQDYLSAVRGKLSANLSDPHQLLGMGGPEDVMMAGRLAVRDAVVRRIHHLGCAGKA